MSARFSAPDWCFFRPDMDPVRYYEALREAGYDAVEMVAEERFAAARAAGLDILNLAAPGMTDGLNRRERHGPLLPRIRRVMRTASDHGIGAVIVFSGNRAGQPDREGLAALAEGLQELLPDAENLGVDLWFEMLCQRDHPDYQADHAGFGFELCARVASPRLRILYDAYHMTQMGEDVLADLSGQLPAIAHVHLADVPARTCPRSDERIPFREIRDRLEDAGYRGHLGLEFLPRQAPLDEARAALRHLRGEATGEGRR